ncbi:MAG: GerW family sporulation protein [Oscillospiraceae bacterium]|nr:GerW family sporulation protein [Oscillospiraceae bacterium]
MSNSVPNMMEGMLHKIREMIDANTVMGTPVTTPDGTTIIPISKVSIGFGGGGSDFATNKGGNPFGGGAGGGVKVTPVAFLVVSNGNVRMLPVAQAANTTADRLVEMIPDTLDKVSAFIDSHTKKEV